jgi:hypothetical protein
MSKKIIRHELVEITIPAGSTLTRFNFPDLPNLRNVLLFGYQVYTVNAVTASIISGNAVLPHTQVLHNSYSTFVNYGGKEFLKQAPNIMFSTLNQNLNTGTNWNETDTKAFVGQRVNWPSSYLQFTTAPADPTVTKVFLCSIYYSLPPAQEQLESGYTFGNKG